MKKVDRGDILIMAAFLMFVVALSSGCVSKIAHRRALAEQKQNCETAEASARSTQAEYTRGEILKMIAATPPKDLIEAWVRLKEANGNPVTSADLMELSSEAISRKKRSIRK